jgi:flagellar motor switch protein FliM
MNVKPYDFRKPGAQAGGLIPKLTAWLRAACELAREQWGRLLSFRPEVALADVDVLAADEALSRLPEAAVGYRLALDDGQVRSLLVWPRPLALAVVGSALGGAPAALPEDRELSVVEQSLCEYLMQDLCAAALRETWPGAVPLPVAVQAAEPAPRFTRLFVAGGPVALCSFNLNGPFGPGQWSWLIPVRGLAERLALCAPTAEPPAQAGPAPRMDAIVQEVPVEVVVDLGSAQVPLPQLAALAPGDVLILDRRVSDILSARVGGRMKLRGWPARVGSRQALQIETLLE